MTGLPRAVVPVVAAVLLGAAVPVVLAAGSDRDDRAVRAPVAVQTALPGVVAPTGDPLPAAFGRLHPRPGEVATVAGPFDDRFVLSGARLVGGRLTGTLTVTSDVSEVIDLEVLVAFYDASGRLLGTGLWDKHGEGARPDEVVRYAVAAAPAVRSRVRSAAVHVPVLVNE